MMSVWVARTLNLPLQCLPGAVSALSFFNVLLICFWLHWVFDAMCRLALCRVCRLLSVVACCTARARDVGASVVVAHRRSLSATCGIFPDQGSNPGPLHWQMDS